MIKFKQLIIIKLIGFIYQTPNFIINIISENKERSKITQNPRYK